MKSFSFIFRSLALWLTHHKMRFAAYKRFGLVLPHGAVIEKAENIKIGKGFGVSPGCKIYCQDAESGSFLSIGYNVLLNHGVMINADCGGTILIGNNVLIGPNVVIRAADHIFADANRAISLQGHRKGTIEIGEDVWLGANVVVLPGISIGKGCVVGAGSVVTKNLPDYTVAVGVPARAIKSRGTDDVITKSE